MRLRSRITDLIDRWRKPPDVIPVKRTWGDWLKDRAGAGLSWTVVLLLQMILWFIRRDSK